MGGALVIAQVLDPDGRLVVLTLERWLHIVEPEPGRPGHEELSGRQDEVMATVSHPDERMDGPRPGQEWFYHRADTPSRWLKVVVAFDEENGTVITAHPRRAFP